MDDRAGVLDRLGQRADVDVVALTVLGAILGRLFAGSSVRWAAVLGCGGVAVTWIGVWLHIT